MFKVTISALSGGEGAVLAVANALQLEALGVEQSQKRARQARNLDGRGAQGSHGPGQQVALGKRASDIQSYPKLKLNLLGNCILLYYIVLHCILNCRE